MRHVAVHLALPALLTLAGMTAAPAAAQDTLDARVERLMVLSGVPGLQLTVLEDGTPAWTRAWGIRDLDRGLPVTPTTVFEAASLSKPVFAHIVLQLVDQGVLDLDRPLADYYVYEDLVHDGRSALITARMVLSHTSGLPNWRPGDRLDFTNDPGTSFAYSGEGFVLLQRTVEEVTGEDLETLARRLVFEPLGMRHSSFRWTHSPEADVALGHREDGTVRAKRDVGDNASSAWSLHTTTGDFALFLAAAMRGDRLSDSLSRQMRSRHVTVPHTTWLGDGAPTGAVAWGLGWGLEDAAEKGWGLWHWGHNSGYRAFAVGYPDAGTGVVFFTNSDGGMLLLADFLGVTSPGVHPVVAWLDYEAWNAPGRLVRLELEEVFRTEGLEAGIARFRLLKRDQPEAFDEGTLNGVGYALLRSDRVDDAIAVFQLNVALYPTASNPYDSLGEAYFAAGDLDRALANYRTSVRLDPDNRNGVSMIERIEAAKRAAANPAGR